jgi:hypothetical protein
VAAHLGISRASAHFLLKTTIERLCREAIAEAAGVKTVTGGTKQFLGGTASYTGKNGKTLKIGVKKKTAGPSSGAVPRPENPAGAGSRPPMTKAMSAYQSGVGAELVAPACAESMVALKRPRSTKVRRVKFLDRLVKGLPT